MLINNSSTIALLKNAADEGRPVRSGSDAEWTGTVERLIDADAGVGVSHRGNLPSASAVMKLSELLLTHTLKEIMPSGYSKEEGMAFDTWRGMLADAIAQEVAPHVNLLPSLPTTRLRDDESIR